MNKKTKIILIVVGIVCGLGIIGGISAGVSTSSKPDTISSSNVSNIETSSSSSEVVSNSTPYSQVTASQASSVSSSPSETVNQRNALRAAKNYLNFTAFSYDGLINQLENGNQFNHGDAVYAADNCGADWKEQAAKKAQTYLELMAFSRNQLIEQLECGDKFTHEQAVYGVDSTGLK